MRLRRLRSGTLALISLRREPERPLPGTAPDPTVDDAWPLEVDPHRPHPAANAWPDDAVLLTYAELRRLVALHLDLVTQCMPGDSPWGWVAARAAAIRDGEAPLLVSEVLE